MKAQEARKASCDDREAHGAIDRRSNLVVETSMQRGRCGSAIPLWHARTRMRLRPFAALLAMTISLGTMPTAGLRADDTEPYRFGPGDRLRITILDDPGISGEFTVQQSGGILLPSVGRIQVVGREFDDLQ